MIVTLAVILSGCTRDYKKRVIKHKVISKEIVYNPSSVPLWPHYYWKVTLENGDTLRYPHMVNIPDSIGYVYVTTIEK